MSEVKYSRKNWDCITGVGENMFHQTFICILGHSVKFHTVVCGQKKFDAEALGA